MRRRRSWSSRTLFVAAAVAAGLFGFVHGDARPGPPRVADRPDLAASTGGNELVRVAETTSYPVAASPPSSSVTTEFSTQAVWPAPLWSVAAENAQPGDTDWQLPDDPRMWDKVRGYASVTSVDAGESFEVFVTTDAASWHLDAYRLGWYGGSGARRVWTSGTFAGVHQPGPVVDARTHMAEARWSGAETIPTTDWPQGMYVLLLRSADGGASYIPMVLRDDAGHSALVVQSSVTTWQAYNGWGDANLYTGGWPPAAAKRATVVSFDRPYDGNGSGELFGREREFVQFAERLGLDVSYWTDVDLHQHPERALDHRAVVSLAHDEYYSPEMRTGLEQARARGVNLAFLGANAVYRKIRFDSSPLGPDRREINYRSTADPINRVDPAQTTVEWRRPPSNQPESALLGGYYECNPVNADWVVADDSSWLFAGTGLHNGDHVTNMVGNEYDNVTPGVPTPRTTQILARSPLTCRGARSYATTTYYTARSGAGVFDAGTLRLVTSLLPVCPATAPVTSDCKVQRFVQNLLVTFAAGPAAQEHPSQPNLDHLGIHLEHPTDP